MDYDDDDDDLYDPADAVPVHQNQNGLQQKPQEADGAEEEEVEVEDDDDEFNIITEAPPEAVLAEPTHPRHTVLRNELQRPGSTDSAAKSATSSATPRLEVPTPVITGARPVVPLNQKPGSEYPPVKVSTIDVHANPVLPQTGKTVLATDMDADFPTEDDKPWRRPGSDISDYFNYGFDEFTWVSYCLKQQDLRKEVGDQKRQLDDMQTFLTMGLPPMPGGPQPGPGGAPGSAPQGMPGMPGMPEMSPDMMQGMLAGMMAQGLDPSSMDPMSFMQHAQAMMGGQSGAGGGQQGQPGFGSQSQQGFGGQGGGQGPMGYGGYDQRSGYGGAGRGRGGRRW
ncbi:hypothetical protein ASPZODRAFT_134377 [Penicilliopsis zonata CBS 506.65]|uniref:Pre-mRNA polyadenylation factor Fip1 domain-containing protein n=1 Tax=Penicilliopsis zonata CBS 506.65 TaxID=1073090 RepID=A0A1L9SCZ6_9EURO|nr:hypothetical protein ASPZODRAFT_134377 [Penicilliopsis zonata CBS 506.65]OJJ44957.1 hypothetical protein ASPZODRAFT_134377 [Penicilliopsis zonata CBS 506.65]